VDCNASHARGDAWVTGAKRRQSPGPSLASLRCPPNSALQHPSAVGSVPSRFSHSSCSGASTRAASRSPELRSTRGRRFQLPDCPSLRRSLAWLRTPQICKPSEDRADEVHAVHHSGNAISPAATATSQSAPRVMSWRRPAMPLTFIIQASGPARISSRSASLAENPCSNSGTHPRSHPFIKSQPRFDRHRVASRSHERNDIFGGHRGNS